MDMIVFTKNKQNGDWMAYGPQSEVRVGMNKIRLRNGFEDPIEVIGLSEPFVVAGVPYVYGYLAIPRPTPTREPKRRCLECGRKFTRPAMGEHGNWDDRYCGC